MTPRPSEDEDSLGVDPAGQVADASGATSRKRSLFFQVLGIAGFGTVVLAFLLLAMAVFTDVFAGDGEPNLGRTAV